MRYIKKSKPVPSKLPVILYDDRERRPWLFLQEYGYTMRKKRLKIADYSFTGFEAQVAIEKKSGLTELLSDLRASYRPTFKRFLTKLANVPVKAIVVEDDISRVVAVIKELQHKSNGKSRLTVETVYYWVAHITLHYRIPIIFTGRDWRVQGHTVKHLFMEAYEQCI